VLESKGFDPTPKKGVALFPAIERGVQLRDNCCGLIGDDDQFDLDLLVEHLKASSLKVYAGYQPVLNLPENVFWIQMLYLIPRILRSACIQTDVHPKLQAWVRG